MAVQISDQSEHEPSNKFNVDREIARALEEAIKQSPPVNILIAGRSGVGKSTLINAVFQGNFVETGQGRPVTKNTREVVKEGIPLRIFDTRGLEMEQFRSTLDELENLIVSRLKRTNPAEHIHVAWICIAEDSRRVEDAESNLVAMLSRHMPVIVIITKARSDNGFREIVKKLLPQARQVIRVRAIHEEFDEGHVLNPMNLRELVQLTMDFVPEAHKNAFAAAQKVNIDLKQQRAREAIALAVTAAAGVGATPVPFADAVAIVPIQIGMLARITMVFGIPLSQAFLSTLVGSTLTSVAGTFAGRAIVASLLKLLPGAGSAAGAVISAATAGALTKAFGEAYLAALMHVFLRKQGETPSEEEILQAFRKEFQNQQKSQ